MERTVLTRGLGGPMLRRQLTATLVALAATAIPAAMCAPAGAATTVTPTTTASPTTTATQPPPVTVTSPHGAVGNGDIFITPTGDSGTYAQGAEILNAQGRELWFHAAPAGDVDADFRTQTYDGQRVLTFWEGSGFGGLSTGTDYIYNDHYQEIAAVNAGNGLSADGHEFLITPWNTALTVSFTTSTANLTSIGGPADQTVINGVVQEIDIANGKVLFQWNSADHVPYSQSEESLPASASTPWDWFHINAIKLDSDGNFLIDARNTWTTYKVSSQTGKIIWQLGGKDSSFVEQAAPGQSLDKAGEIFAWQHDPEAVGNDEYTVFDDESAGVFNEGVDVSAEFGMSRVVRIKINPVRRTATLIQSDNQPANQLASSQGNGQPLPGGGEFVGWGNLNSISEFDRQGDLQFNADFPTGVNTYRAYLLPWSPAAPGSWGHPARARG